MNYSPLFSIIIPTYNHAHLLKKCIDSILNQTYQKFEILIINNFSKDNTVDIVNSYHDERIKLLNHDNKGVIANARNLGIKESTGDLIAFLDSDDSWYNTKLNETINAIIATNADVICHNMKVISHEKPSYIMYCGPQNRASFSNLLFKGNSLILSGTVITKNVINKAGLFSEESKFITAEDYEYWIRIAKQNFKFSFINKTLGEYLVHSNNASKSIEKCYEASKNVIMTHYKENIFTDKLKLRNRLALLNYTAGRNSENTNKNNAIYYFLNSIKMNPFIIKTYISLFFCVCSNKRLNKFFYSLLKSARYLYYNFYSILNNRKLK